MGVSSADRFVIASSQTLIASSADQLSFEEIKARLEFVRERLCVASVPTLDATTVSARNHASPRLLPIS